MDEDSPKNNANDADESSPRKKTKTEDQQQPSTSPAPGASTSSGIIASTSAVPIENNPSASANERPNESVDDPPQQPVDVEDALLLEAANSASQRARSDSGEQSDDESEEARADDAFIQNLERSVERLRRNVRRLTNRNDRARDGADENAPENEPVVEEAAVIDPIESLRSNRIRNRIVNDIAQLFVPNVFRGYESNEDSIDSIDVAQVDEEFQVGIGDEEETNREFEIDADGSESDSSSNTSSSSTLTSTSESSFSYGHSSDSAYDYVHLPPRDDAEIPDCLKISSVKCQWNVVREIYQRQHGVRFHKTPTTVGKYDPSQFQKRAYGSVNLVKRLGLLHKLQHHRGCVNCLNFHPSGKLLASGSDDLRIILWNWETKKLIKSLRSGHKSNVFQTKFMVCEEYRDSELEIISTGRDGAVRHMIVDPSGHPTTKQIFRSSKPVHKVAIPARNDRVFLTAGEDETVRLCDLRQAKVQTLVNVHKRLYSIATHPFDSEFCVAGTGNAVRVYDLRRAQHPKKVLVVGEPAEQRLMSSITCAVYNHDGTEILASYNDGDIHLFKLDLPDLQMGITIKFRGHSNLRTIKGVNFFGPHSEFVASGSDCGSIYLWEKSSQTIVNWLRCSSSEVVNCLEPHPEFPILASSGVDNDIKIWVPKGLHDEQTATPFNSQDLKRYVLRNLCQRDRYDYGLPSGHIAHLFPNLSHGARSSLRDFPDDDDRVGLSRFDCSPS